MQTIKDKINSLNKSDRQKLKLKELTKRFRSVIGEENADEAVSTIQKGIAAIDLTLEKIND